MKNMFKIGTITLIFAGFLLPVLLSGCYSETIDALSKYNMQLPLHFMAKWREKHAPDTSLDYTNLDNYKEYRENKAKIQTSSFYQFSYWIDSIRVGPGDPPMDSVQFEYVRYYLFYNDGGTTKKYLLGEFKNVRVKDYYRIPHIIPVPDEVAKVAEAVTKKSPPDFYTIAEYGKIVSGGSGYFPHIDSRFDVVVRFQLKL